MTHERDNEGQLIVKAEILSCKNLNYFITQRLKKQLKTLNQSVRQSLYEGFEASD